MFAESVDVEVVSRSVLCMGTLRTSVRQMQG
jgi:hypothetical protein